jgi:hypothetical protein
MRFIFVGAGLMVCAVCESPPAFAAPMTMGSPSHEGATLVLVQTQRPSQRTAKRRRPARRNSSSLSNEGSSAPPASSNSFDPKKIWETD